MTTRSLKDKAKHLIRTMAQKRRRHREEIKSN